MQDKAISNDFRDRGWFAWTPVRLKARLTCFFHEVKSCFMVLDDDGSNEVTPFEFKQSWPYNSSYL